METTPRSNRIRRRPAMQWQGLEQLENRLMLAATISGTVFEDADGDGSKGSTESGLSNWVLFIDYNNNGIIDPGDPTTTSDGNGNYSFSVSPTGSSPTTYNVREEMQVDWARTTPAGGVYQVSIQDGQTSTGNDFGNKKALMYDFNQDQKRDILWTDTDSGRVFVDLMNEGTTNTLGESVPATRISSVQLGKVGSGWEAFGAADYDGDGNQDVWFYNASNGVVSCWLMNKTTVIGHQYIAKVMDTDWSPGAINDFNADGRPDLVWHNATTGVVSAWYMINATVYATPELTSQNEAHGTRSYTLVGGYDVNNDTIADLIWRTNDKNALNVYDVSAWVVGTGEGQISTDQYMGYVDAGWQLMNPLSVNDAAASSNLLWSKGNMNLFDDWYLASGGSLSTTVGVNTEKPFFDSVLSAFVW